MQFSREIEYCIERKETGLSSFAGSFVQGKDLCSFPVVGRILSLFTQSMMRGEALHSADNMNYPFVAKVLFNRSMKAYLKAMMRLIT